MVKAMLFDEAAVTSSGPFTSLACCYMLPEKCCGSDLVISLQYLTPVNPL